MRIPKRTRLIFLSVIIIAFTVIITSLLLRKMSSVSFVLQGTSMQPTYFPGDQLSARVITKDLESLQSGKDIYLFKDPGCPDTLLCKRCIAGPGETVSIVNGYYFNGDYRVSSIPEFYQDILSHTTPAGIAVLDSLLISDRFSSLGWTSINFGPYYVPRKGDIINLDSLSICKYQIEIEYETNTQIVLENGEYTMNNEPVLEYCFKNNWYFFGGDNVLESNDSRNIGLIPESLIVAKII